MTPMTRFEIFKRDKFTCQYCGQRAPHVVLELEHIHPLSKGGTNDQWNLLTACHECNQGKLARPLTTEQIHRIDGHVPNMIAQLMALASDPRLNVVDRLMEISCGGRLIEDWIVDLDALWEAACEESWKLERLPE